jgi:hypothetical protein
MSAALVNARQEWEEGHRRLQAESRDAVARERLHAQVEVVVEELRRRIGQTFTLAELAEAYGGAERWVREAVSERAGTPGWPQNLALVAEAAFYAYARGATDYRP